MVKRKRSKFENFFNLNRYRKRQGATVISQQLAEVDYEQLKTTIITGEPVENFQSLMIKDLNEHLEHLKLNFIGQPEICYYHAKLIVLIRREAQTKQNFARFNELWHQQADFLLEHLNMRWLISACDTFIDHSDDETLKAILLNAVTMINTIKLYETEYFLLNLQDTTPADYVPKQLHKAQHCFNLFDELPSFRVGVDDTLRNMRWRMDEITQDHPLAHKILTHIFDVVNTQGSVYTRFRACHHKPRNAWWSE
ncbi:hypothetical protein [Psychrobacter sp. I-STPA6b]|uniref:hypothetical protein n=1 Tax=Psychrobacter sp. I-STPA6b TaxID=2585718 RepID=UPI001D0C165D|nr:hypothetical protein [Psychrobacter sp. I-STPA6b]